MLPFQNQRHEASTAGEEEPTEKVGEDVFGMLDAITEDIMHAIHSKDQSLLKGALEALIEHIREDDEIQDQFMTESSEE